MDEPLLLIETSGRGGQVGLAAGGRLFEQHLDPARRHARDLAPAVAELLAEAGLKPRDVRRVGVSVGPGSFTGLRVGIMSAKAFAYATGCELVAVPTFAAIAEHPQVGRPRHLHVVADGLQGLVYHEEFMAAGDGWRSAAPLRLVAIRDWQAEWSRWVPVETFITGPGLPLVQPLLPSGVCWQANATPVLPAMATVARRLAPLSRDEMLALEPLYLRGSSAEEKAARDGRP